MIKIKVNLDLNKKFAEVLEAKKQETLKSLVEALRAATPVDTGHARDSWTHINDTITNDAEYIDRLNAGSSQQAPAHFIEKTVLSHKGVIPNGTIVRSK
jgi:hypothetical protein